MTAINNIRSVRPPPALHFPVAVQATSNDPSQRVKVDGRLVTITGAATNNGIIASHARFTFDGKTVSIPLSRGMSPSQTLEALRAKLPAGYAIQGMATPMWNDAVSFQIVNTGPVVQDGVAKINAAFSKASEGTSPGKSKMTYAELRTALRAGTEDGFLSAKEKDALAKNWASLFTGAGFHATAAAQREFARLQERFDLPVYPVH